MHSYQQQQQQAMNLSRNNLMDMINQPFDRDCDSIWTYHIKREDN